MAVHHQRTSAADRGLRVLLASLALCGLSACDRAPTTAPAPTVDGSAAYLARCAACHQREGQGLRGAFPPLAGADWLRDRPVADAIDAVLYGLSGPLQVNGENYRGVMPPAPHLSDAEIAAILTHVYASWGNAPREISAAAVAERRAVGPRALSADGQ